MPERSSEGERAMERHSLLEKALRTDDRKTWQTLGRDPEYGDIFRGMQSGNDNSFVMAANLYMDGNGVPQNPGLALKILQGVLDHCKPSLHPYIQERMAAAQVILGNLREQEQTREQVSDDIIIHRKDVHVETVNRFHDLRTPPPQEE